MKNAIEDKSEEQKKKFFKQESALDNTKSLLQKRQEIINWFTRGNIISADKKFFDAPRDVKKRASKTPGKLVFKPIKVS